MQTPENTPLVTTIKEHCRVCYTCVRECPAKAIRIADGQAEVIPKRCIGCGNCVRVCSQKAKKVLSSANQVEELLQGDGRVAAVIAPSFPADFPNVDYRQVVGMIRALGFDRVNEVAFGADLVARAYRKMVAKGDGKRHIATSCPAIVGYVERYHPNLVKHLSPIVSPMIATVRALRSLDGDDLKVVFIGPCIAKKGENPNVGNTPETDAVLTFVELRRLFESRGIKPGSAVSSDFDPPHAGPGALFAISRGMLQAADLREDLVTGEVVAAEGRQEFVQAIREFESGHMNARLLEVLCCDGCIMGSGMNSRAPLFSRRSEVSRYVQNRMRTVSRTEWEEALSRFEDLDLTRGYVANDLRIPAPSANELAEILARMGKESPEDELNCGACGYETCREHAIAIFKGMAESEMCLPNTIEQLKETIHELAVSDQKLTDARRALMQSEKLASMGQLAAGIAHEVNNPLGVVLMYAHMLKEETDRKSEAYEDLSMIADQADRCKKIVSGLLNFARQNKVVLLPVDLRELVDHTLKVMQEPDQAEIRIEHRIQNPVAELDRDQITQVLTNLVTNAFAAIPGGGTVYVETEDTTDRVRLIVRDTGSGIPKENLSKIFEPFFTTKQIGKGTGLGLAVTYGIIKMHNGDIRVESNTDSDAGPTGTTFTVTLPRKGKEK